MIARRLFAPLLWAAPCVLVAACGNPYALKTSDVEYKRPQTAGSITFDGPKLYKREALINERREEVQYYTTKIGQIDQVNFTPEIIRELQVVSSLSASLGLKFDPAAALKYRRDEETSGIQQEISTLKLQLQLDQLKRDAELVRAKLPDQTDPVNQDVSKLPTDNTVNTPSSTVTTSSLTQLASSVDALKAQLQTALATNATALQASGAATSPFDAVADRAAYRDLLNGARNAASLDELHDLDGAALIRLNLTATVMPPAEKYLATFGRLQMTVHQPKFDGHETNVVRLYNDWLRRLNSQLSVPQYGKNGELTGFQTSSSLSAVALAAIDLFDLATFDYSTSGTPCAGVQFGSPALRPGCIRLRLAIPKLEIDTSIQHLPNVSYAEILENVSRPDLPARLQRAAQMVGPRTPVLENCLLPPQLARLDVGQSVSLQQTLFQAIYVKDLMLEILFADQQARSIIRAAKTSNDASDIRASSNLLDAIGPATELLSRVFDGPQASCKEALEQSAVQKVPPRFLSALGGSGRVSVYEMGPKSRVQMLSSMARAAEAINLAGTISGQMPSSGLGVDGNVSYGRSAVGKADAMERVPLVVAYSEVGQTLPDSSRPSTPSDGGSTMPVFGWLMGPRTTLDAKKKALRLEQVLTYYDLSVDLSVPGSWPYVDLDTDAVWAPDWQHRNLPGSTPGVTRPVRVPLAPAPHDLDNLTGKLLGAGEIREAVIDKVVPDTLSACAANAAVEIDGDNIWRATQVVIGGRVFDGDAVKVLPDMRGLLVNVSKAEFPVVSAQSATLTALTPYGPARYRLTISDAKPDGTCSAKAVPGAGGPAKKTQNKLTKPGKPAKIGKPAQPGKPTAPKAPVKGKPGEKKPATAVPAKPKS